MDSDDDRMVDWNDVIKKEARGTDDCDLGEVQDLGATYVHTQSGVSDKTQFYIPKYLINNYDGHNLWFNITEENRDQFAKMNPPTDDEYRQKYWRKDMRSDIEQRIPLVSERLDVKKRPIREEAVITKEPIEEEKTLEVPVKKEQVTFERRPASSSTQVPPEGPVTSKKEYRIPIEREEVAVQKTPEVREEVVARKTPTTETRRVTDKVKSETIRTTGGSQVTTTEDEEEEEE